MRGRPRDDARSPTSGVVYVEFLMAFTPVFLLFVGVAQLILLFGARLVVHHANVRAARSAIVVADDDPRFYATGETRGSFTGRPARVEDVLYALGRGQVFPRAEGGSIESEPVDRSRRSEVEVAAALVLLPLAPTGGDSLADAIASAGLSEAARGTLERMELELEGPLRGALQRDDPIRVRLTYRYPCLVPLARRLVCRDPGTSKVLESELTLTNQGAGYPYDPSWTP
jgi:hypothetical protein